MAETGWFSSIKSFATNVTQTALTVVTAPARVALSVASGAAGLVSTDAAKVIDNANKTLGDVNKTAAAAVGTAANWTADRVGQGDGSTITSHAGDKKAEDWKNTGYDTSIFNGANKDGITEDALKTNAGWLKACATIYEMKGGTSLSFLDRNEINELKEGRIPATLTEDQKKQLGQWGMGEMSWFNNNIVAAGKNGIEILRGTDQQKTAYLYMMEAYEHKNMSLSGWGRGLTAMAADPTTYVGIASFGVGFVAKEGAKEAAKLAFKESFKLGMREVIKEAAEKGLEGATKSVFIQEARQGIMQTAQRQAVVAATRAVSTQVALGAGDATISAAVLNSAEQSVRIAGGRQEEFELSQLFTSSAIGAATGGTLSVAAPAAAKWLVRSLTNLFGGSADNLARPLSDTILERVMPTGETARTSRAANDILETANDDIADEAAVGILRGTGTDGPVFTPAVDLHAPGASADSFVPTMGTRQSAGGFDPRIGGMTASERARGRYMRAPDHNAGDGPRGPRGPIDSPSNQVQLPRGQSIDDWLEADPSRYDWWESLPQSRRDNIARLTADGKPFNGPDASRAGSTGADAGSNGGRTGRTSNDTVPPPSDVITGDKIRPSKWFRPKTGGGDTGIQLPGFHAGVDPIKFMAKRSFDPFSWSFYTGMTKWGVPVKAMRIRSDGIVRPVIGAVDEFMQSKEITKGLRTLQEDILKAVDKGASDADVRKLIDKFATDNREKLGEFKAGIAELRKHVNETYGTTDTSTLRYGLTLAQKTELITYLDDMSRLADDLADGTRGSNGREMLDTVQNIRGRGQVRAAIGQNVTNTELTTTLVRDSVNGLSRANYLATNSDIRFSGQWDVPSTPSTFQRLLGRTEQPTRAANAQWRLGLERSIDVLDYDTHSLGKTYTTYSALAQENLEQTAQNDIFTKYASRDAEGNPKFAFNTDQHVTEFVANFIKMRDRGYGHEAFEVMDGLRRLRQPMQSRGLFRNNAQNEADLIPSEESLKKAFKTDSRYGTDPGFTTWADNLVSRARGQVIGRHKDEMFGTDLYWGDTRTGRHIAYAAQYPWFYATRWRSTATLATPGKIEFGRWFKNNLLMEPLYHFGGAYKHGKAMDDIFGHKIKGNAAIDVVWKAEGETSAAVIRRAVVRTLSVGLINDLSLNPARIFSKRGFMGMGSGLLMVVGGGTMGAGYVTGSETTQGVGQSLVDYATLPTRAAWGAGWNYMTGSSSSPAPVTVQQPAGPQGAAPGAAVQPQPSPFATPTPTPTASPPPVAIDGITPGSAQTLNLTQQFKCLDAGQLSQVETLYNESDSLATRFGESSAQVEEKRLAADTILIQACVKKGYTPAQLGF